MDGNPYVAPLLSTYECTPPQMDIQYTDMRGRFCHLRDIVAQYLTLEKVKQQRTSDRIKALHSMVENMHSEEMSIKGFIPPCEYNRAAMAVSNMLNACRQIEANRLAQREADSLADRLAQLSLVSHTE